MHIDASFPPVAMARGVLNTLRASLQPPPQPRVPGSSVQSARVETTIQALKCFDECLRYSDGQNMWALLGKARLQYSLGKYADALESYQEVLSKTPRLIDPDPRIGIGCCFWQLGFKEDAKGAWKRALELVSRNIPPVKRCL
jgi:RNA polymerase-associated protein CTR9